MKSPAEIKALYVKHYIRPKRYTAVIDPEDRSCCVLGIMYYDKLGKTFPEHGHTDQLGEALGLTFKETVDIQAGFDGGHSNSEMQAWGAAVAKECFQ